MIGSIILIIWITLLTAISILISMAPCIMEKKSFDECYASIYKYQVLDESLDEYADKISVGINNESSLFLINK